MLASLTVLFLAAHPAPQRALPLQDLLPSGSVFGETGLSRTTFMCRYPDTKDNVAFDPWHIHCDFTYLSLTLPTAANVAERVAEQERAFESGWKEQVASSKDLLKETRARFCQKQNQANHTELEAERRRLSRGQYASVLIPPYDAFVAAVQNAFGDERLCACADLACVHDTLRRKRLAAARFEAEQCSISAIHWESDFDRVGPDWVHVEPSSTLGNCYASQTVTIFRALDGNFWNMRTVGVPKQSNSQFCSGQLEDVTATGNDNFGVALNCKILRL